MNTVKILRLAPAAAVLASALLTASAGAQEAANQAVLTIKGSRTVFKNVTAIRAPFRGEKRIVVLATQRPLTAEVIKKVKEKDTLNSVTDEVNQAYLFFAFDDNGAVESLSGQAGGTSFSQSGGGVEGKGTLADGRFRGALKLVTTGSFAKELTMDFDVPVDAEIKPVAARLDPPVKPTVSGKFTGEEKPAEIKYVLVEETESFGGKEAIRLIFTEKDPAGSKKPGFDASFGKLGSALVISAHYDGNIFGCEVFHRAFSKGTFSSVGKIHMEEFEMAGGNVTGHLSTGGPLDAFGQKWDVDLKFAAPLPEKLRKAPAAAAAEPAKGAAAAPGAPKAEPKAPVAAGPRPGAGKLPLPQDATDVQFKEIVNQIQFSSARPVEPVAKEFSAKLKEQGWKEGSGSLMGKTNAILKREMGEAKLTIMVQPAGTGSVVKIFTEGLDWSGVDANKPAAPKPAADPASADDIEAQANKLMQDALKGLPKGF